MAHDMGQVGAQEVAHAHRQAAGPVHAPVPPVVDPIQCLARHTHLRVVPVLVITIKAGRAWQSVENAAIGLCRCTAQWVKA